MRSYCVPGSVPSVSFISSLNSLQATVRLYRRHSAGECQPHTGKAHHLRSWRGEAELCFCYGSCGGKPNLLSSPCSENVACVWCGLDQSDAPARTLGGNKTVTCPQQRLMAMLARPCAGGFCSSRRFFPRLESSSGWTWCLLLAGLLQLLLFSESGLRTSCRFLIRPMSFQRISLHLVPLLLLLGPTTCLCWMSPLKAGTTLAPFPMPEPRASQILRENSSLTFWPESLLRSGLQTRPRGGDTEADTMPFIVSSLIILSS